MTQQIGWNVASIADMNADGWPDLVFQNTASGQLAIWYMNGQTVMSAAYINALFPSGWASVGPK
ncbi:MAG TPA: VCBS repeat-containing protein [Chthonomonadaceae bacterium]|nr:VCBS repeat-containing protein [Chthonomonadaceae bacterium]